jgi:peroxiredoxin
LKAVVTLPRWLAPVLPGLLWALGCASAAGTPPAEPATSAEGSGQAVVPDSVVPDSVLSRAGSNAGPRPPDFELEALDGTSLRLSDQLDGKVVLIDFWATFCDPCLAAMPHLEELYRKHRARGFLVLGVSIDGPESVAQVRTQVSKTGVTFPILLDAESTVIARYNPRTSAPFSVHIGRDGRVLKKQEGYTTGTSKHLEADIEQALGP